MSDTRVQKVTVAEIEAAVERLYDPGLAEDWDRVGLIVGDRTDVVDCVLVATDPVADVVDEALAEGAQMILTHHPLYLRGESFFPAQDPKGNVVHRLISASVALMNAHTNADSASGGVATALAELVGLKQTRPLQPDTEDETLGLGRVGTVEKQSLREFAERVAAALPASPHGIFVGGDLDDEVETVAVSGGAGDSLLEAARAAGADVFLTADLRHHPASEHLEAGPPALICGSHWATESPWTAWAARALQQEFPGLRVVTSRVVSEPWVAHFATTGKNPSENVAPAGGLCDDETSENRAR